MREFNTREAEGDYSITFETDDKKAFEQVQTLCRILIDGKDGGAIPIEWIEEYAKSLVIKRRFLAENGYRDNRCYDYMLSIIGMLDDWDTEIREKENEQSNSSN